MTRDVAFDDVVFGSACKHRCSPVFDAFNRDDLGIKINAPKVITVTTIAKKHISAINRFPVCIAMQLPARELMMRENIRSLIALVLQHEQAREADTEQLGYARPFKPLTRSSLHQKGLDQSIERRYYNVNVFEHFSLLAQAGTYRLFATFKDYRSNVLSIRLVIS